MPLSGWGMPSRVKRALKRLRSSARSIASGLVRIPFGRFVLICLAGRSVRFGVLAAVPALIRAWIGP